MGYGGKLSWIPHLKTSKGQPFVGSNPTPSATNFMILFSFLKSCRQFDQARHAIVLQK